MCVFLTSPVKGRVLPEGPKVSYFQTGVIRNIDSFHSHWGVEAGFVWRRRFHILMQGRTVDFNINQRLSLHTEVALARFRFFILEAGYIHTLHSRRQYQPGTGVVRVSFPTYPTSNLTIMPNATVMRTLDEWADVLANAGIDLVWSQEWLLRFDLNLNQDFRYHNLDIMWGYAF